MRILKDKSPQPLSQMLRKQLIIFSNKFILNLKKKEAIIENVYLQSKVKSIFFVLSKMEHVHWLLIFISIMQFKNYIRFSHGW